MYVVASKQQTTALFLSTIVKLTTTKKKWDGKTVLSNRTFSSVFVQLSFTQLNCTVQLRVSGALKKRSRLEIFQVLLALTNCAIGYTSCDTNIRCAHLGRFSVVVWRFENGLGLTFGVLYKYSQPHDILQYN